MKIYITGLPSGYEVEHLARLFYPMAPLTLTPPEPAEDCLWAEKTPGTSSVKSLKNFVILILRNTNSLILNFHSYKIVSFL